ncbi:MAG: VOC family protein [Phycisphaerales bacterium JB059]
MGAVRGLAEIVLNARDLDAMTRFYVEVMGFRPHSRYPSDRPTIVFLEIAPLGAPLGRTHPQLLALIDPARHISAKDKFDQPEQRRSALNHLAFMIEEADYEGEFQRLEALGLGPVKGSFEHMRAKAIFFRDPEGNRLELICHDRSISEAQAQEAAARLDEDLRPSGE